MNFPACRARTRGHVSYGGKAALLPVALGQSRLEQAAGFKVCAVARGRMQQVRALYQLRPQRVALARQKRKKGRFALRVRGVEPITSDASQGSHRCVTLA